MSKTVVYIGGFELPDKNAAAHRVLSNAKLLREIGYNVVFIGIDKNNSINSNIQETKTLVQGFDTYSIPYPMGVKSWVTYLTDIESYINIIQQYKDVEMIILYNFQAAALKKLMTYCHSKQIKCCADVTEWRSTRGENYIYRIIKGTDTIARMRFLHKKLDGLIVISQFLRDYYAENKNVVLIPTLVDIKETKWAGDTDKSKKQLRLVYAGNPGLKDRLDMLIKSVIEAKRKCILDIIGITKEQYLQYYPQDKRIIDETNEVFFHGRISHLEALSYVKQANFSCFFRENDRVSNAGFPTKLAEAISCGTPVITNITSNIEEYVANGINGYLINSISSQEISALIDMVPYEMNVDRETFDYRRFIPIISESFFGRM